MTTGMETDIINQSDFGLKGRRVMNSGIRKILSDYNSLIKENDSIYRAAAKSSGISEAAFWILYMIRESGEDFTQNRICSEIHIPKQTVNSALSSLIKDGYIYMFNFKPDLWPAGNPETGYLNCDGSPVKSSILRKNRENRDTVLWHLAFGKHPQEELYDMTNDPMCLDNLAYDEEFGDLKESMHNILFEDLKKQKDPRVIGKGDIFDQYPFCQQSSFWYYERYMAGEIKTYQTDWVSPSDYEKVEQ